MMKFASALLAIALILLVSPKTIYGHAVGQPPYFKVDGIYAEYYPVPLGSTVFEIPNDLARGIFKVGKPIQFEIETATLGIPQNVVDVSTFYWDFGDGSKAQGLKNTHTYNKTGSFVLKIDVTYPEISGTQILQATQINVVENENDQTPKAIITINGKKINDPLVDVSYIPSGQEIELSAELESGGDASFTWDLGNGQTSTQKTVKTTYQKEQYREQFFPIVRAKTENGFYADAYAQITTNKELKQGGQAIGGQNQKSNIPKFAVATVAILAVLLTLFIKLKKKK